MQERQQPQTATDNLAITPQPTRRAWLVPGTVAALLALFVVGCPEPADLQNPEQYPADESFAKAGTASAGSSAGGSGGSGSSGGSSNAAACEVACVAEALKKCTLCHGNSLKSANLDLQAAGITARLRDQPATHGEVQDKSQCPTGDKLIDSANAAQSWFLKKITNEQGSCGTVMPVAPPLVPAELECLKTYVNCAATGGT